MIDGQGRKNATYDMFVRTSLKVKLLFSAESKTKFSRNMTGFWIKVHNTQ